MKNPTCSVCQLAWLLPGLLDAPLCCLLWPLSVRPWCCHPTTVGNSVETLKKNFLVLSLIHDGYNFSYEEDLSPEKAVEVAGRRSFERESVM
ncbi:hypothetical protein AMTRI_Chr09g20060 [Amborella trichopoda]